MRAEKRGIGTPMFLVWANRSEGAGTIKTDKEAGHGERETEEGKGLERRDGRFNRCHVQLKDM